ncbi:DENN domain-containing protein 1B isoform X2 [Diabrotica virgifera virgifera]|uniref:UDENN domain-containing protein n=2 Tax=Diabrotica virgifera virgifera TaxID=50390 RepID=A0ABM5JT15_DIAVI|nr:DENN domain-containing protein 1B isoform X2 [Diabrotica virgifera virgifera]
MGSRIRENVKHFFECFCEVVPPRAKNEPWIIQQYPEKYKDEEVLKAVPKFAYPYKFENDVIQHYSFVLTDLESKWTFGFCRHDPKSETAIVVLSYLPWHQGFYKFLDTTAVLMHSSRTEDLSEFLTAVYTAKIAEPGRKFVVTFNRGDSTFTVDVPRPFQLPSIPENRNLTEYFNAVDTHTMSVIFASMLFERRIIFTSKKLKRLSACVQSANDIIYPMIWQHIFIPVLPMALMDYLLAPMPFLIGVPEEVFKQVRRSEIGDVVILDTDANTIETPFDDLNSLPTEVVYSLRKQLKNKQLGDGVSRAFLRALVQLIGGYRDALKFQPGQKVTFDEERFIETRPPSLQPFLREMLHLQIFQQFIEERLTMLNTGQGFSDEFEFEIEGYSAKSGSKLKQQYKEWTTTMKKEGTAFFKSVKDKANPAMKSAVKTVKDGGKGVKSAYKGLRSKLKDNPSPLQLENGLERGDKHRSAPNSPTGKRSTIAGFSAPVATYRKDAALALKNSAMQRSYSPLSPSSQPMSPDVIDSPRSGSPVEIPQIDLINEMEDLLQFRLDTPPVDRSLKPVRSLENFKNTSPLNSPDRWAVNTRASAPMASPSNRFFLQNLGHSQETQNLLQSPDEIFLSPPSVPPRKPPRDASRNLFSSTPFVVGGGHSENGDPLFFVANQHSVDIVKLSPPSHSPRRKNQETEDLIRLDSTSDIDDFDPLASKSTPTLSGNKNKLPLTISNPLYTYENSSIKQNGGVSNSSFQQQQQVPRETQNDQDLLQEYGLNFNFSNNVQNQNNFDPFGNSSKVNVKSQWTKFD